MSLLRRASVAAMAALAACTSRQAPPDIIAIGHVWTGDSAAPGAQAVSTRGDSIIFVGDSATALRAATPATRIIRGAMVTPGFGDAHTHFLDGGFQLASVDLRDARTPAEFTARIKQYAAGLPKGTWILGGNWDHENWGGLAPTRHWIDSVTPDHPVFVSRLDGHMGLANSLALRLAGMGRGAHAIPGGTIVRDKQGELTGLLKDEAAGPIYAVVPTASPVQYDSALSRATRWAAAHGVTTVDGVSMGFLDYAALQRAHRDGRLVTRVHGYFPLGLWRMAADSVHAWGPGDAMLRAQGVKGFVDGSLGSTTALFFEPYLDAPGDRGLLTTPAESLAAWIGAADSAGLQVVVHAIGDRANAMVLDIYDSVGTAHGARDRRFRVEHAQHLRMGDIARFARLGVIASMQPYHLADDGRWAHKRLDPARLAGTYAFRSLLDSGVVLAFGSDWTVAPLDPILGMHAAVTRETLDGANPEGWIPEQKISVEEALAAYTRGVAYAHFREAREGMIKPGMVADLVVLDRDLTVIPPREIKETQVLATVVAGRVAYEAKAKGAE